MTVENPPSKAMTEMEPGIRRIIAPNPSPMTYWGTNTYLVGYENVAVIDPGPVNRGHFETIIKTAGGADKISHVIVTHAHVDHSLGARPFADLVDAPIYAFGAAHRGQSDIMRKLVASGYEAKGEGIDVDFVPDEIVNDGDRIMGQGWALDAIWTPGHLSNHLCFAFEDALFSGDHVMQWATSIVSPPEGDVGAFLQSCKKLLEHDWRVFYPGHGDPVEDPKARSNWLIAHRKEREAQILALLAEAAFTPTELVERIYTETPPSLYGAARRNVFAHLIDLSERGLVTYHGEISDTSDFHLKSLNSKKF